jgi:prepilin-type N-terminal cleavage/methylation domain-containing protein
VVGRRGFTILEVLIALVVLVIGILGVFALVPTSVKSAASTVDDLHLAQQAESIVAALRLAARERAYEVWEGVAPDRRLKCAFLVLPHPAAVPLGQPSPRALLPDGRVDPTIFDHPACILLPHGAESTFVYPRVNAAAENALGDAATARDDLARAAGEPLVRRVYGNQLLAADGTPLPGYGFALVVQRAAVDGVSVDGLYRVTVLLYHGFIPYDPASPAEETKPAATYTTELMVGPMTIGAGP